MYKYMMNKVEKIKAIQNEALKRFQINRGNFDDEINNINDIISELIRIENKIYSIITMIGKGEIINDEEEPLKNILLDLQNYSIRALLLLEE